MNYIKEEDRIYIEANGRVIAQIDFEKKDNKTYSIVHTYVDERLRGKNIASNLVEEAVTYIHEKGYDVDATCSYAKKWLEKHKCS